MSERREAASPSPVTLNVDALQRVERVYRQRLDQEPADLVARTSLAWCLFLQALHRAGQESVLAAILDVCQSGPAAARTEPTAGISVEAARLLRDCLRQATAVRQLSQDPEETLSIEMLQQLVRLSGGGVALSAAEDDAAHLLNQVAREVLTQERQPRLQRLPAETDA